MRLRRRSLLGFGAAGCGALALIGARRILASGRGTDVVTPIRVSGRPVRALAPGQSERQDFGSLRFRSGLVLSSDFVGFGGFSALWRSPDGRRLVSLTDNGQWLTAEVEYQDGRLAGLADVIMAPILDRDGTPLRHGPAFDTESLAFAGGSAFVGSERVNEVRHFDWARDGVRARGTTMQVPSEVKALRFNDGLEALAVPPSGHPLAGCLIGIAEDLGNGDDGTTRGWVLTGERRFAFDVVRSRGYDITDLTFLPSGEALLLERRFRLLSGVACRIRRLAPDAFRPDAAVDGPAIFQASREEEIDNMEGISTHPDPATGQTIVTLVSDDNFSPIQRTLLLEFVLDP